MLKHAGHVPCVVFLQKYIQVYMRFILVLCLHIQLQSIAITLYLSTIILVYSRRIVAGAVSKGSPS